jgi:hypothetical protein
MAIGTWYSAKPERQVEAFADLQLTEELAERLVREIAQREVTPLYNLAYWRNLLAREYKEPTAEEQDRFAMMVHAALALIAVEQKDLDGFEALRKLLEGGAERPSSPPHGAG